MQKVGQNTGYQVPPVPRDSDSVCQGWGLINCIPNFPGDADTAGQGTTL